MPRPRSTQPIQPGHRVVEVITSSIVTSGQETTSEAVVELAAWEQVQLLACCVLPDGSTRACCSTDGVKLLGWLTIESAAGARLVYRHARPIYTIVCPTLKVRKKCGTDSKFVTQLAAGLHVHLTDVRRMGDGSTRARVVVLNHPKLSAEKALGWITASKPGSPNLRSLNDLPSPGRRALTVFSILLEHRPRQRGQALSLWQFGTRSANARRPAVCVADGFPLVTLGTVRRATFLPDPDARRWRPLGVTDACMFTVCRGQKAVSRTP